MARTIHPLFEKSYSDSFLMGSLALILSGCGSLDGSDVWEVFLLSYHLYRKGRSPVFFAPDTEQEDVVDHFSGIVAPEKRNVLSESARIARGGIKEIRELSGREVDGIILPGGGGAAKNLADLLGEPRNGYLKPRPELQRIIREIYRRRKPIAACGLAVFLVASALRDILETPLTLTIGKDPNLIRQIEGMGAVHVLSRGKEVVMDSEHKLVTTAANLLELEFTELATSMENMVNGILELTSSKTS
jgi:enhancing lycopene biosynthesis protein 2